MNVSTKDGFVSFTARTNGATESVRPYHVNRSWTPFTTPETGVGFLPVSR